MVDILIDQFRIFYERLSHALADLFDRLNGSEAAENVEALHAAVETHARAIREAVGEIERQLREKRHAGAV